MSTSRRSVNQLPVEQNAAGSAVNTESVKMPSPMLMMMNVIMIMKVEENTLL